MTGPVAAEEAAEEGFADDGVRGRAEAGAEVVRVWHFLDKPLPNRFSASIQILRTGGALVEAGGGFVCLCGPLGAPAPRVLARYGLAPRPGLALRPFFPGKRAPRLRRWLVGRRLRALVREVAAAHKDAPGRGVLMCRGEDGVALLPALGPLARAAGVPLVQEMHCLDYLRTAERRAGRTLDAADLPPEASAARERERAALAEADAFVFLTPQVEAAARAEFDLRAPGLVLPSGADATPPAVGPDAAPPRYDLVYAGKIEARKGVRTLCEAMRFLPGRRLAIAGGPEEAVEDLRLWLGREGLADRVTLVGLLPPAETAAFLRSGRVGACPMAVGLDSVSDRFTSPMKLSQMMGLGMAVVAADVAPVRAVARDGETALLAPPEDPAAFAAAVARLLDDPALATRLGAAARVAAEPISWGARAAALREFLAGIAPGRRG